MKRDLQAVAVFVVFALATGYAAQAPTPPPPSGAKPAPANMDWMTKAEQGTPLKLQFVISKYQGEKKISSVPYVISLNSNQVRNTSLRMGGQVPLPTSGNGPITYREIGTNIDVAAWSQTGQLFRVEVTLEDSSVFVSEKTPTSGPLPAFRSFKITNNVVLKDGQTSQVTTATDPITGDIVRVDLTLTVLK